MVTYESLYRSIHLLQEQGFDKSDMRIVLTQETYRRLACCDKILTDNDGEHYDMLLFGGVPVLIGSKNEVIVVSCNIFIS